MASKAVMLIAGLFVLTLLQLGPGASQEIPDDKVYTELKKILVNGSSGILTCRFTGPPYAVYWKKGHDPWTSPTLLRWTPESKTGPRYEDSSCDMNENYSLIIKTVNYTDTGRYICFVSNQHGILIDNYTDVTVIDSAMRTEQSVAVQRGEVGVLSCQVNIRPRRVSWVRGANYTLVSMDLSRSVVERSGPGYEEGLFNVTSEYALLINDVKILHEDSYFCEVTDFDTGHLFRNVTRLNVFAFPLDPFPSIEECSKDQQDLSSCTLTVASQTELTCEVREYYPVIDLFFMHGSLRVDFLETKVWNNSDGTRNKRITIVTDGTTKTAFECVATGFVGEAESRSMTIHLLRDDKQTRIAVAIVIPGIIVSAIIVIAVYVFRRRKRHMKRKYDSILMIHNAKQCDLISNIELWTLVKYAREQNLSDKLGNVLDKLTIDDCTSKALQTDEDYYQEFCQWKARYTATSQKEDFVDACRNAGLKSSITKLKKYSDSAHAVTADDLQHTLWHVTGSDRIHELLTALGVLPDVLSGLKNKGKREVVDRAMDVLKHLTDIKTTRNQEVMLSRALEKIKYSPDDNDFFQIPECQKRGLDKNDIQAFLSPSITSRHCTELINATMAFDKKYHCDFKFLYSKNKDVWIEDITNENRTALFDSHQMIEDWLAEQNCSNNEKRCRLHRAANVPKGRTDILEVPEEAHEKWPANTKLEHIAKLVPQTRMIQLWDALHISYTPHDLIDEDKRFKTMCRWRDGITQLKQEEKSKVLSKTLKSIGFDGMLSRPKSSFIYKAELVDVALDLIMEDFRPFADSLGIERTKLTSYRREFRASQLDVGTIGLVIQLFKKIKSVKIGPMRPKVCSILDDAGYPNVSKRFTFASEPSYGELFSIATAVTLDDMLKDGADTPESSGENKQAKESTNETVQAGHGSSSNDGEKAKEFHTGHEKTPRSDSTQTSTTVDETLNNDVDREVISTEDLRLPPTPKGNIEDKSKHAKTKAGGYRHKASDLQNMLDLTDGDIPGSNVAFVLTLFKIWKERVCPGLINHRVVLAEGLQKINKPDLVADVINGKYHSRETSLDFIDDMVNKMDEGERISLRRLLEIKDEKQGKAMSSDEMSRRICVWVANWTKAMESSVKNKVTNILSIKAKWHRDFNDKLVDNGFLDLAREIMNIERVL